ncbi:hypothetical protein [Sediminicoccus sp. BL-A-41-H5]|uniref:hypothetical protein n=1 Tax=Sediminicoccus sp. BL-A-41-H5 TaxID=3421106 RepID=UPI003D66732E
MASLPLTEVRFDADCQSRVCLDEETVAEYAFRMKEGAEFPPLVVFFDGADHWLADGFHRYAACKGLAREGGNEGTAVVSADIRQGTRLEAVRHALSANALHGKRREPGDYRKGYSIAVRCRLCEAHDAEAVRRLLACSERWARELTSEARDAVERERDGRIVEARRTGERVRSIAARENLTPGAISKIEARVSERQPAEWKHSDHPIGSNASTALPAAIAALDRPSLTAWSDAIYALEKLIDALDAAKPFGVPRKAMPRVQALVGRASNLINNLELEPEYDVA